MKTGDLMTVKGEAGIWRVVMADDSRREAFVRKIEDPPAHRNKSVPYADLRPHEADLPDIPIAAI